MDGIFNRIPILTALTFLSYITYFSYKTGESFFYGYPISFIQVDFSTLIFTLMRVSILLLLFAGIMWFFIVTKSTYWDSFFFSAFSYIFVSGIDYLVRGEFDIKSGFVNLLMLSVVFVLCHFYIKLSAKDVALREKIRPALGSMLGLIIISFFMGNYFGPMFSIMEDNEGNVIVSEFKDGFLTLKCYDDLSKSFSVIDIKDKKLNNVSRDYLTRHFIVGECNPSMHYE